MIVKGYIFSILYALLCIALSVAVSKFGVPKKYTRKLVHILVGFEWVILTHYMGACSHHFLAVCLLFTLLLFIDYKMKLVPAMSSDGDNAPGTVYYAVAMSIMATVTIFVPNMIYPFGIGVFCTSLGDGLAAVVGQTVKTHNPKIFDKKSLWGTLTVLFVCFATPLVFSEIFDLGLELYHCLFIAIFAATLELFTGFGLDNIIITVGTSLLTYFLIFYPATMNYIVPILVTPLIIVLSLKKKALTLGGVIGAVALDLVISVSLGNFGFVILISFFACAVLVDKIKKRLKRKKHQAQSDIEKRGDCRDFVQVLSNGLPAGICAFLYIITFNRLFIFGFVASLAEALADTVASGIGSLSGKVFDVFRMRKCEAGESGGMSLIGTFSSLIASFAIAFLALAFGEINIFETLIIAASAFLGGVFDSFLGSLVQVKYKCSVCGKIVEKEKHCTNPTVKYRGIGFVNNDTVNLSSTVFAAAAAILLCYLLL